MAAVPVVVSTASPVGGPALRVRAVAPGTTVEGGAAIPVYVVSAAELAAGTFKAQGNVIPVEISAVVGRPVRGQRPVPVVVVSGTLS